MAARATTAASRLARLPPHRTPSPPPHPTGTPHAPRPGAAQGNKSFFSEIIASISDIRFSRDGRYILSRDYMTVKLWDLAKENMPVATFNVHEQLRQRVRDGAGVGALAGPAAGAACSLWGHKAI